VFRLAPMSSRPRRWRTNWGRARTWSRSCPTPASGISASRSISTFETRDVSRVTRHDKMNFTEEQITRYSRHILLPEVGGKGQRKIAQAKILLVGAGGLGSPAALYLAAAGVGTIGLIDSDVVDLSNLQRQVIHHTPDVGRPKVVSAQEKISALNPDCKTVLHEERLVAANALGIISQYDVVLDGVDNFPGKFLINDACYFAGKPLVHAGI